MADVRGGGGGAADRNLLFGILALQMDFLTRDALVAGMNAWVLRKGDPLGLVLEEQGALSPDDRAAVEALLRQHLRRHGGDVGESLRAVAAEPAARACEGLRGLTDADVQASVRRAGPVAAPPPGPGGTGPGHTWSLPPRAAADARFQVLRFHARGGLGEVFVAEDRELRREVALKEIQLLFAHDPESQARFVLEAEVTGTLEHPGIVPVYGLGHHPDGRPYYAMRFIRGQSLKEAIAAYHGAKGADAGARSLALRELLTRFLDVCNAVSYAHSRDVLHRDLKPGNVMLGPFGETLVVDWGLAKVLGKAGGGTERPHGTAPVAARAGSSLPGTALGTPSYMSPEQARGAWDGLGPASDVYSLGATLYHLLTGRAAFEGDDTDAVLKRVIAGDFPRPQQVERGVPPALESVCLKAMANRPEDRYPTALALADDLKHWLADEPVSAHPEGAVARASRWARRHRAWAQAGAAALFLTTAVSVAAALLVDRERRLKAQALVKEQVALKAESEALTREKAVAASERLARQAEEAAKLREQATARREREQRFEAQAQSAALALERGLNLAAQGDPARGLLWMARALALEPPGDDDRARTVRVNLNAWAGQVHRLRQVWLHTGAPDETYGWNHSLAFSPDGRFLASGSSDEARVWHLDGAPAGPPLKHGDGNTRVLFLPDGKTLATTNWDRKVRLWRVADGAPFGPEMAHAQPVSAVALSPDGKTLVTGGADRTVRFWNTADGAPAAPPLNTTSHVTALAVSPDGATLAVGLGDGAACLVATADPKRAARRLEHAGEVRLVRFSPDGRRLLAAGFDGSSAVLWDVKEGSRYADLRHDARVTAGAFSPDGRLVATGSDDHTARLWTVESPGPVGRPLAHGDNVMAVEFSPDGSLVVTGSKDRTARAWETTGGLPVGAPMPHPSWVIALAVSPDGRFLATGSYDRTVRLWELAPAFAPGIGLPHRADAVWVAFSPDGALAATGSSDRTARLWRAADGSPVGPPLVHQKEVSGAAFSPDGRSLVTASFDGTARVWDVATGTARHVLTYHDKVFGPRFSPDGSLVVAGATDGTTRFWRADTGAPVGRPMTHLKVSDRPTFRPDGRVMATNDWDNPVRLWSVPGGEPVGRPMAHVGVVAEVAFSPDGRVLATAGYDRTVRLWSADDGSPVGRPLRHQGVVSALAYRPDGKLLMSGGLDHVVRLWDPATGAPAGRTMTHDNAVNAGAFSPDGRVLATVSADATLRFWSAPDGTPLGPPVRHWAAVPRLAFNPDGRTVLTGDDPGARLTPVPTPLEGDPAAVRVWAEAVTGLGLDDDSNALEPLDPAAWSDRRRRALAAAFPEPPVRPARVVRPPYRRLDLPSGERARMSDVQGQMTSGPTAARVETHLREALALRNRLLGPDHPDSIRSAINLAAQTSNPTQAEALYDLAARLAARALGPDDELTLAARRGSSRSKADRGLDGAGPLLRAVLADRRKALGPDHPDTLESVDDLGLFLMGKPPRDEAAALFVEAAEARARLLGPAHRETLASRLNQALALATGRLFDRAEPAFAVAREGLRREFGDDDRLTLMAVKGTGDMLVLAGRVREAEPYLSEHLVTLTRLHGRDDDRAAAAALHLATCYQLLRRFDAAEMLLDRVYQGRLKLKGKTHADTLTALDALGYLYLDTGRPEKARDAWNSVAAGRIATGGTGPESLQALLRLTLAQDALGRLDLVEKAADAVLRLRRKSLADEAAARKAKGEAGPEAPDETLESALALLARARVLQGKFAEAEAPCRELMLMRSREPDTWTYFNARAMLGACLVGLKRYDEAERPLLSGFTGMRARRATIPPRALPRLDEAGRFVVRYYEQTGDLAAADEWRAKLGMPPRPKVEMDGELPADPFTFPG